MSTPSPDAVKRLVDHLDRYRGVFLSTDCKEEQLRAEFGRRTGHLRFPSPIFASRGRSTDDTFTRFGVEIGEVCFICPRETKSRVDLAGTRRKTGALGHVRQ
jgi:hypothetical protein